MVICKILSPLLFYNFVLNQKNINFWIWRKNVNKNPTMDVLQSSLTQMNPIIVLKNVYLGFFQILASISVIHFVIKMILIVSTAVLILEKILWNRRLPQIVRNLVPMWDILVIFLGLILFRHQIKSTIGISSVISLLMMNLSLMFLKNIWSMMSLEWLVQLEEL